MSLSEQSITTATANNSGEPPQKKQKLDDKLACVACTDELTLDGDYLTPCRECDEKYCYDCARRVFETALNNPEHFPPRCCAWVWYTGIAEGLLSADDFQRYKAKMEERMVPDPLYCPVPTCSEFIARRLYNKGDYKVACPKCGSEACTRCKNAAVEGHECNRNEFDAMLRQFDYKRCPRCRTAVARLYGCPHMQCHCGAHWCWACLRPVGVCNELGCQPAEREAEAGAEAADDQPVAAEPAVDPSAAGTTTATANESVASAEPAVDPSAAGTTTATANESVASAEPATNDSQQETVDTREDAYNHTAAAPQTGDQANRPSTEAETIANLDDTAIDWEGADLELNDEPGEQWDSIFDCSHDFYTFRINTVPDRWFKGLDKSRGAKMECMMCFKDTFVPGKKKTSKDKEKIPSMHDCTSCGLLVCPDCRIRHQPQYGEIE